MAKQIKSDNVVGIDIGSNSVKLVSVSKNRVVKVASVVMPESISADEKYYFSDEMAEFIKKAAQDNGITTPFASIIIPSNQVYVRNVTLPAMTERQLKINLPFEFSNYLDEDNNKYYFDYALEEMRYDDENKPVEMKLFACAASKQIVENYRVMLKKAGFTLLSVVPAEYAIGVTLKKAPSDEENGSRYHCVADLGYKGTELLFYDGTKFRFKRTVDFGMYDIELRVAEIYETDIVTARSYIISNRENVLDSDRCKDSYNALSVEIMKVINYFNYNYQEADLKDIYVCGGGAFIGHFGASITSATGLSVRSAAELFGSDISQDEACMYLQAYGCTVQE